MSIRADLPARGQEATNAGGRPRFTGRRGGVVALLAVGLLGALAVAMYPGAHTAPRDIAQAPPPSPAMAANESNPSPPSVAEPAKLSAGEEAEEAPRMNARAEVRAREYVDKLWTVRDDYRRNALRREMFEEMARDRGVIETFVQAFEKDGFAASVFGDDQGQARVLGVRFLSYVAEKGNGLPLERATAGAIRRASVGGDPKHILLDVQDLMRNYAALHIDDLGNDPGRLLGRIGYDSSMSELKHTIGQAVFDALAADTSQPAERWTASKAAIFGGA
ncbi:hypothetical protein [Pendulispora albinea]|uniref:Uncharacterized protein n=1 Tax=Pendulispora albinea TaxID=2741071 RepID=A0ABZ2M2J2_9BACT